MAYRCKPYYRKFTYPYSSSPVNHDFYCLIDINFTIVETEAFVILLVTNYIPANTDIKAYLIFMLFPKQQRCGYNCLPGNYSISCCVLWVCLLWKWNLLRSSWNFIALENNSVTKSSNVTSHIYDNKRLNQIFSSVLILFSSCLLHCPIFFR